MNGDVRLAAYAPADGGVNDHCIVRAADGWHYFFIYRRYDLWDGVGTTAGSTIGHAHSPDLFRWRTCADALQPDADAGAWDGAHVWAPHVVRRGGYWYMAYAGVDRHGIQRLGVVRSADLHDWERFTDGPVLDAARFSWFDRNAPHAHFYDCRDPFLLEHGGGYLLYYTARADDDVPCIAAAASDDLLHWQDRGPVLRMVHYQPDGQQRTPLESCCVFARDGLWYLVYQLRGIRYHVSRDPLDWHGTPPHTFSTTKWLFRWADPERNLHIYKTRSFFGVLRFGLVRWEGDRMLPDHDRNRPLWSGSDYQMPWP